MAERKPKNPRTCITDESPYISVQIINKKVSTCEVNIYRMVYVLRIYLVPDTDWDRGFESQSERKSLLLRAGVCDRV
jgi:hypothetical protein